MNLCQNLLELECVLSTYIHLPGTLDGQLPQFREKNILYSAAKYDVAI